MHSSPVLSTNSLQDSMADVLDGSSRWHLEVNPSVQLYCCCCCDPLTSACSYRDRRTAGDATFPVAYAVLLRLREPPLQCYCATMSILIASCSSRKTPRRIGYCAAVSCHRFLWCQTRIRHDERKFAKTIIESRFKISHRSACCFKRVYECVKSVADHRTSWPISITA